ncbi:hypothetical protein GCM10027088_05730 [Nocardia goodfellowii]
MSGEAAAAAHDARDAHPDARHLEDCRLTFEHADAERTEHGRDAVALFAIVVMVAEDGDHGDRDAGQFGTQQFRLRDSPALGEVAREEQYVGVFREPEKLWAELPGDGWAHVQVGDGGNANGHGLSQPQSAKCVNRIRVRYQPGIHLSVAGPAPGLKW